MRFILRDLRDFLLTPMAFGVEPSLKAEREFGAGIPTRPRTRTPGAMRRRWAASCRCAGTERGRTSGPPLSTAAHLEGPIAASATQHASAASSPAAPEQELQPPASGARTRRSEGTVDDRDEQLPPTG